MSEASELLVGALEAGTELVRENKNLRAAGDELAEIVAALENAVSENRMDNFAISAAAALQGIKTALHNWREVTK